MPDSNKTDKIGLGMRRGKGSSFSGRGQRQGQEGSAFGRGQGRGLCRNSQNATGITRRFGQCLRNMVNKTATSEQPQRPAVTNQNEQKE